MRVLFKDEFDEPSILEITYATYDKNLYYCDSNGEVHEVDGLYISDADGDGWVLPNVTLAVCEDILVDLLQRGIYDLRNTIYDWRVFREMNS